MADCKICENNCCPYAKTSRSGLVACSGYKAPPKTKTNADRIRAMSDEELAYHIVEIGWDCHLCSEHTRLDNEPLLRGEDCDEKCVEHCLEWLKQPAEEK